MTLKAFIDAHLIDWTKDKCESEQKNWHRSIKVMAPLYNEPIAAITPSQVLGWIRPLWDAKTIDASRTLGRLGHHRGSPLHRRRPVANSRGRHVPHPDCPVTDSLSACDRCCCSA